jgi:DHA2 family multidrug resistance protein
MDIPGVGLLAVGLGCLQYVLEEGNAKLWFQSSTIVTLAAVSAVTLPAFIWWELHPKNLMPVVNLRVLRNRDLSASLVLFIVLGFGLYGGLFLFPMFAQNILRLTPTDTGLLLLPGGIATGVAAMLSAKFANPAKPKIDARILIAVGLALFSWSMLTIGSIPSTGGSGDMIVALLARGFGLGLLFVPINLAAFASLKGAEIAQGSGLMNLCRQLGGSFGIAVLGSFVTKATATARAGLVDHITIDNPQYNLRWLELTLLTRGPIFPLQRAAQNAFAIMDRQVMVQASTLAYHAGFFIVGVASIITAPLILLIRKPKPK